MPLSSEVHTDGLIEDVPVKLVPIRKYDPKQPRDPRGTPTGGQWTSSAAIQSDIAGLEGQKFGSKGLTVEGEWKRGRTEDLFWRDSYTGVIRNAEGAQVGEVERLIFSEDVETPYAAHQSLHLNEDYQRTGFATEYNAALESIYAAHGIETVRVMAIGDGAFVWAKAGFRMDDSRGSAFDARAAIANAMRNKAGGDPFSINDPNPKVTTPADKQRILDMADAFETGSYGIGPSLLDIANLSVEGFPDMGERILTSGVYFPGVREVAGVAKSAARWPDYIEKYDPSQVVKSVPIRKYSPDQPRDELGRFTYADFRAAGSSSTQDVYDAARRNASTMGLPNGDPAARGAVSRYSQDMNGINGSLRAGNSDRYKDSPFFSGPDPLSFVDALDRAVDSYQSDAPITVFRGDLRRLGLKPGDLITNKGYTSTSLLPGAAEFFADNDGSGDNYGSLFRVNVPQGTPMTTTGAYREAELLLGRDTTLRVDRAGVLDNGTEVYEVTVVPSVEKRFDPSQPRDPRGTPTGGQWSGGSYRGGHTAPYNDGETPSLAFAATGETSYPKDLLGPNGQRYYGMGSASGYASDEQAAIEHIREAMATGGTNKVTVYRALPDTVKNAVINPGDWVTPSLKYAEDHGKGNLGEGVGYQIIETTVPASELYTDGNSLLEWGWDPSTEVVKFVPIRRRYNPQQPRHPRGTPNGGQWASSGFYTNITITPTLSDAVDAKMEKLLTTVSGVHSIPTGIRGSVGARARAFISMGGHAAEAAYFPVDNEIHFTPETRDSVMLHEFGHYLDYEVFGPEGSRGYAMSEAMSTALGIRADSEMLSSAGGPQPLDGWYSAVSASAPYGKLSEEIRAGGTSAEYAIYAQDLPEVFARTYAQWVATKSGDAALLADVLDGSSDQWTAEEFAPISAELDKLFSDLVTKRFNPAQPRDPKGVPTGGRWTAGGVAQLNGWSAEGEATQKARLDSLIKTVSVATGKLGANLRPVSVKGYDQAFTEKLRADSGVAGWYDPKVQGKINVNLDSARAELFAVHEYAHVLDFEHFGKGTFGTGRAGNVTEPVVEALQALPGYKEILYGNNGAYWASSHEMFARGFAQWVTMRSGDPVLAAQFAGVEDHWDVATFEPVAAEFDKLFATVEKKFNPSQPRDPKGTPTGGRWTSSSDWAGWSAKNPGTELFAPDGTFLEVAQRQGFDAPARPVSRAAFDSNPNHALHRGVGSDVTHEQITDGPLWAHIGNDMGGGIYFARNNSVAESFSEASNVITMKLRPDARVVKLSEIEAMMKPERAAKFPGIDDYVETKLPNGATQFTSAFTGDRTAFAADITSSAASYAAALGYDAIEDDLDHPGDYWMVVNRGALEYVSTEVQKYNPKQPRHPKGSEVGGQWQSAYGGVHILPDMKSREYTVRQARTDDQIESNNLSEGDVKRHLGEAQEFLDKQKLVVNMTNVGLTGILADERFKTLHETGDSGGNEDPDRRLDVEHDIFGLPYDLDVTMRPVYGYLWESGYGQGRTQYGQITMELRDSVRPRTTFVQGDSLSWGSGLPSALGDVAANSFQWQWVGGRVGDSLLEITRNAQTDDYLEIQVHGGVSLKDVAHVTWHLEEGDKVEWYADDAAKVDAAGIPWSLVGASGEVLASSVLFKE